MLYFPQLTTGSVAQYPCHKERRYRTVVNETPGGSLYTYADGSAVATSWNLSYTGLTDAERARLEQLFSDAEGRLLPFVFTDPFGNMLRWSERLDKPAWTISAYVHLTSGLPDPLETTRATRVINAAQTSQEIIQEVSGGGPGEYCFSLTAKAEAPCKLVLAIEGSERRAETTIQLRGTWADVGCSTLFDAPFESLKFVVSLEPGATLDVFGCTAQAQRSSSGYRPTRDKSGLYERTYFADDDLRITANGPDNNACELQLMSFSGISNE